MRVRVQGQASALLRLQGQLAQAQVPLPLAAQAQAQLQLRVPVPFGGAESSSAGAATAPSSSASAAACSSAGGDAPTAGIAVCTVRAVVAAPKRADNVRASMRAGLASMRMARALRWRWPPCVWQRFLTRRVPAPPT
jgi:hypothetical protein